MHITPQEFTAAEDTNKLSVLSYDYSRRPSACEYYRVYSPTRGLEAHDLAFSYVSRGDENQGMVIEAMLHADIVHLYALDYAIKGSSVEAISAMKPTVNEAGHLCVPPSIVYDIDDNNDYVHPFNPAFAHLGYRTYPEGKLMVPGDNISIVLPDGVEQTMWEDQKTQGNKGIVFDITRNRETVASQMQLARSAHGVTVPSVALAKYFKQVQKCANVHVFPNTIMPEDWYFPNLVPRTDGKIRILWQGGDSHAPDFYHIKDALTEICKRYPDITFVIWGGDCAIITEAIPEKNLERIGWVGFDGYRLRRALIECDINLALLTDNKFNHCKSAIKWYEASIGPNPQATLAANVEPYSLEITDGVNGLLYDSPENFVQKLSLLIENATLRRQLSEGARDWVLANRTWKATIPPLHAFYQELRAMRRQEYYAK